MVSIQGCKPVSSFGLVVLHQMISRGIWYFLPQSIAVATINWESIAVKATISVPGISLRLSISRPLSISVESTIAITSITKAKTVAVESTVSQPGIGLRHGLSIGRPLSVAVSKTAIA